MHVDLLCLIGQSTTDDLPKAAARVLREALDRAEVHPCHDCDDRIRASQLDPAMKELLLALTGYNAIPGDERTGTLNLLTRPAEGRGIEYVWMASGNTGAFLRECSQWYQGEWVEEGVRYGFLRRTHSDYGFEKLDTVVEGGFPIVYRIGRRRDRAESRCMACAT